MLGDELNRREPASQTALVVLQIWGFLEFRGRGQKEGVGEESRRGTSL